MQVNNLVYLIAFIEAIDYFYLKIIYSIDYINKLKIL